MTMIEKIGARKYLVFLLLYLGGASRLLTVPRSALAQHILLKIWRFLL